MRMGIDELMKRTKKAIIKYNMISDDKGIMVGLSGGKDSLVLLMILKQFQAISKYKFPLAAGHIDLGFAKTETTKLATFCYALKIPFYQEKTQIAQIVFEVRQESHPCSLCANMRRGALNSLAKKHGFDKVALGHHQDDVVETTLLKTFFEGTFASFKPVTYLERKNITVIRPLIYSPESLIAYIARINNLPVMDNPCPASGNTSRAFFKEILAQIAKIAPKGKDRVITALEKTYRENWDSKVSFKE